MSLPALSSLCSAAFELAPGGASEVKVWTHSISPEWISEPLPTKLCVRCDSSCAGIRPGADRRESLAALQLRDVPVDVVLPLGSARPPGSAVRG